MRYTKMEAVIAQIEGAIRAHEAGDYACAVTLAGAAEGAMPQPPAGDTTLWAAMKDAFAGRTDWFPRGEAQAIAHLNAERDWLKHFNVHQPNEIEIKWSVLLIFRAVSRFNIVYGIENQSEYIAAYFTPPYQVGGY